MLQRNESYFQFLVKRQYKYVFLLYGILKCGNCIKTVMQIVALSKTFIQGTDFMNKSIIENK